MHLYSLSFHNGGSARCAHKQHIGLPRRGTQEDVVLGLGGQKGHGTANGQQKEVGREVVKGR